MLQEYGEWCDKWVLVFNTEKTKEMVVTYSNKQRDLATAVSTIHRRNVELAEEYKYLGTIVDSAFNFASNTEEILRRYQQWQYLVPSIAK